MTTTVFLHIDRTGGMAVRNWLAAQFPREQIRPVSHHAKATYQPVSYPLFLNADLIVYNQGFVHKTDYKLVMGHWDAGILDKIPGDKRVITVLRHPAERAVSLWRFICQEQGQYGLLSDDARRRGLIDFMWEYREIWTDVMVKQLCGSRWNNKPLDFQVALKNVQEFDTVWMTDQLPILINAEPVNLTTRHGTPGPEFGEMVAEQSPLDMELYQIAKKRCEIELQQNHLS